MTGKWFINGIDIYFTFGVYIVEGGIYELLQYPPLKAPRSMDYFERNGIEVDLSSPKLNFKEFEMKFAVKSNGNFNGFISLINGGDYVVFEDKHLWIHRKIRSVGIKTYVDAPIVMATIQFIDDFPIQNRNMVSPSAVGIESNLYGFGQRSVSLEAGKTYIFSASGNCVNAENGKFLRIQLVKEWGQSIVLDIKTTGDSIAHSKFVCVDGGQYTITSYYYDATSPRTGTVKTNWYKLEEYGLQSFEYKINKSWANMSGLVIDGNDLSYWGIVPIKGTKDEIMAAPELKQGLSISNSAMGGQNFCNGKLNYKSKTAKLKLILLGYTMKKSMQNYMSFLHDLTKPGLRTMTYNGMTFKFYYKQSTFNKLHVGGDIWMEFDVEIEITKYNI